MIVRRAALLAVLLLSSTPALADDVPASAAPVPSASTTAGSDPNSFLLPVHPATTAAPAATSAPSPTVPASAKAPVPVAPTATGKAAEPPALPASKAPAGWKLNTPMEVGLTLLSIFYFPPLVVAVVAEEAELLPLALPVAGPWITASITNPKDWGWTLLGSLSGLQLMGAAFLTFGALLPGDPPPQKTPQTWHIRATPVAGPSTWGISVQGAF